MNTNGKMYVFELQLKDCFPSSYKIGQKHKTEAFLKILQGRQSLVFTLSQLLGHHEEFKVTEGIQYQQKGNRDKRRGN